MAYLTAVFVKYLCSWMFSAHLKVSWDALKRREDLGEATCRPHSVQIKTLVETFGDLLHFHAKSRH